MWRTRHPYRSDRGRQPSLPTAHWPHRSAVTGKIKLPGCGAARRELGSLSKGKLGHWSVAFSSKSHTLAVTGFDGSLNVFDAEADRELLIPSASSKSLRTVTFSPDGTLLATGGDDRAVHVFDPALGPREVRPEKHTSRTRARSALRPGRGANPCLCRLRRTGGSLELRVRDDSGPSSSPIPALLVGCSLRAPDCRPLAPGGMRRESSSGELETNRSRRCAESGQAQSPGFASCPMERPWPRRVLKARSSSGTCHARGSSPEVSSTVRRAASKPWPFLPTGERS